MCVEEVRNDWNDGDLPFFFTAHHYVFIMWLRSYLSSYADRTSYSTTLFIIIIYSFST